MSSWRDRIVTDSEKEPARTSSWRDRIVTDSEEKIAPTEVSFLDKVAAIPSGLVDVASAAGDYLGRSVRGEIPLSEQLDRAGTLARGTGDMIQAVGDAPAQYISKMFGLDYEGAGAKETAKLLDKVGAGSMESMEQSDAKFPGARGLGQALPLAIMPANAAGVVAGSALGSYGAQVADKGSASAKGVVEDTALGLGMFGGLKGAGAVANKAKSLAPAVGKTALKVLTDTSPEMADELMRTPKQMVNSAKSFEELSHGTLENVGKLKQKVIEGSNKAYDILEREGTTLPKQTILNALDESINDLSKNGLFTSSMERDAKLLSGIKERIAVLPSEEMTGGQIKGLLQQIDATAGEMSKKAGDIMSPGEKAVGQTRRIIDGHLKSASQSYAEQMSSVAGDAELLSQVNRIFGNETTVNNAVKNASKKNGNPFYKSSLKDLDGAVGGNIVDEANLSNLKSYFEKDTTNGSRKTLLGSIVGGSAGSLAGPAGSLIGGALGAGVGSSLDKYARPFAASTIRLVQKLDAVMPMLGKYAKVLKEAAAKGSNHLLLTHNILMKNEDYARRFNENN